MSDSTPGTWHEYRCTHQSGTNESGKSIPCGKLLCKYKVFPGVPYAFEIKCTDRRCKGINYRGSCITNNLVEVRCDHIDPKRTERYGRPVVCNKRIADILPGTVIQRKCPGCGNLVETKPLSNEDKSDERSDT